MKPSVGWALVGAQFGLIAGLIFIPPGELWSRGAVAIAISVGLIGGGVVVAGLAGLRLGPALTPSPIPNEGADLVTTGIYRFVRHPIYTGVLLISAGLVALGASVVHLIGAIALFAVLSVKATAEEAMLSERHQDYDLYRRQTGRIIPKLIRRK